MAQSISFFEDSWKMGEACRRKQKEVASIDKGKDTAQPSWPSRKNTFDHYIPSIVSRRDVLD